LILFFAAVTTCALLLAAARSAGHAGDAASGPAFAVAAPSIPPLNTGGCGGPRASSFRPPGSSCSPPPPPAGPPDPPGPLHGKLVAFTSALDLVPGNDGGGEGIRGGIYVVRADGAQPRKIITYDTLRRSIVAHTFQEPDDHPQISPDGRRIVWTSSRADESQGVLEFDHINWDIYVADINGTNVQRLTTGAGLDTEPTWAPDGAKIYWVTGTDPLFGEGNLDIWRMNPDGSGKQPVVATASSEFEPEVSPDNQRISFTRDLGGVALRGYEVFTRLLSTGSEKRMTNNNEADHDASWSANNTRLFVTSEEDNIKQPYGDVYRLDSTTGEVKARTTNRALSRGDPSVAPDQAAIAAMEPLLPISRGPHVIDLFDLDGNNLGHVGGPGLVDIHPNFGVLADSDGDSIPDYLESGSVGEPLVDLPRTVRAGESFTVRFAWKHPEAWRGMDAMELFLTTRDQPIAAVRLLIGSDKLSAWDNTLGGYGVARRPGGNGVLRSGGLRLELRRSRVIETSEQTITTRLRLDLAKSLAGHTFGVQVQADDLDGDHQGERIGGETIRVRR
jgi:TolB protein